MSAPSAKDSLRHLIELAQREEPADRRTLAGALCDLLLDWPQNYPANMREPFEALLEKLPAMWMRKPAAHWPSGWRRSVPRQ